MFVATTTLRTPGRPRERAVARGSAAVVSRKNCSGPTSSSRRCRERSQSRIRRVISIWPGRNTKTAPGDVSERVGSAASEARDERALAAFALGARDCADEHLDELVVQESLVHVRHRALRRVAVRAREKTRSLRELVLASALVVRRLRGGGARPGCRGRRSDPARIAPRPASVGRLGLGPSSFPSASATRRKRRPRARGAGVRTSSSSSQSSGIVSSGTASFSETTAFLRVAAARGGLAESAFGLSADVAAGGTKARFLAFFLAHLLAFPTRKPVISSTSSRKYSRTGCVKPRMNTLRTAVGPFARRRRRRVGSREVRREKVGIRRGAHQHHPQIASLVQQPPQQQQQQVGLDAPLVHLVQHDVRHASKRGIGHEPAQQNAHRAEMQTRLVPVQFALQPHGVPDDVAALFQTLGSDALGEADGADAPRCVHTMFVSAPRFSEMARSRMNWGTCVDLPQPVSPDRTTTGAADTAIAFPRAARGKVRAARHHLRRRSVRRRAAAVSIRLGSTRSTTPARVSGARSRGQ